ncbi:MAG: type II secretion system inner membrane protein GspF [Myxococcota bacterium]|jgi:general secretion pathway protein F|nr:type II secretion system inner membrane protein GspF [Myxococcota bacterium]OQC42749.1 MAG: Type II secretion system protein F [Deltaproteobacteria bacterium ADurb.Bin058]HHW95760.1 type II secretion system inner membrane protein GspF [Oligoflexales bacterium]MBP8970402.1 type II secretion system inner membrane protein GspF [Myxococcota bacterium]HQC43743.1 type II secretion system inner membrane protein GspF [Myxococcota bacterium]
MPLFEYKGYSSKGKQVTGVVEADGPADLRGKLLKDGVYLTSFAETGGSKTKAARKGDKKGDGSLLSKEIDLKGMFERVKPGEIAVLTRQFGTLLRAGIPMTEALTALVAQQEKPKLKAVMTSVREKVREGSSLADALAEHRKIFTDLYINMVRVGEASGTLDIVLERLADFLESNVRLRSKVTSAMIYPILMAGVGLLIVALMMLLVVPRMVELFEDMGGELPLLTRILIFLSDMATNTWFIGLPLTILAIWWFKRYINTEKGRWWWDGVRLRAPLFGPVVRLVSVARFARTLATLLTSGVPVLSSLDIVKTIVNNVVMAKAIDDSKVAVREGESLATPLQKSGLFPPMMTHMIAIGEKTGQLEGMLKNVADAYDSEVDSRVTMLTAVMEPVMIVGMGIMVSFLVFAILMPMLKMNEVIAGG